MARLQPEGGWLAPLQRVEKYLIAAILVLGIGTAYYVTNSIRVPPATVDGFLERSLDRETLEVTSFTGSELNNDRALGLLLSSQGP